MAIKCEYEFRGIKLDKHDLYPFNDYIVNRVPPGSFVTAVLQNNLFSCYFHADDNNFQKVPAYVAYLYNHAPANCWGSEKAIEAWLKGEE